MATAVFKQHSSSRVNDETSHCFGNNASTKALDVVAVVAERFDDLVVLEWGDLCVALGFVSMRRVLSLE